MDVMDDHKAKKKAIIRKRNKRDFVIRKMIEDKERENERSDEDEAKKQKTLEDYFSVPGQAAGKGEKKVSKFKARMTNSKKKSKERWNRFAGTSGGGARGL